MTDEKALTPTVVTGLREKPSLKQEQLEVVRRADARLRRRAGRIVEAVPLAARLDDSGLPVDGTQFNEKGVPEGWTAVQYNIAKDSRRPLKTQPGYLATMTRIHESYVKAESNQPQAPKLNVDVKFFVHNEVKQYAVVDVTEDDVNGR